MNRIKTRNRSEESGVELEYLIDCHSKHVDWLENKHNSKIININGHLDKENMKEEVLNFINNI